MRWRSNLVHTVKQAIAPDTCVVFTICVTALPLTPIGSVAVGDEDTIHGSEDSDFGGREDSYSVLPGSPTFLGLLASLLTLPWVSRARGFLLALPLPTCFS